MPIETFFVFAFLAVVCFVGRVGFRLFVSHDLFLLLVVAAHLQVWF